MSDLRDTELRGNIPKSLMVLIDALSQADGHASRFDWLIPVLQAEADRRVHAATVLLRIAGINPLQSARRPSDTE